jgi:hypothetical protein
MRHVNVKLDDEDWSLFERLRGVLNARRRRQLSISTVLRLVIRAGIEATEGVVMKATEAPVRPAKEAAIRWEKHVSQLALEAEGPSAAKDLYARFERRCDQARLTPHGSRRR